MSARRPWRYRQAAALAKLEAELRAAEKRSLAQDKQHDEAIAALHDKIKSGAVKLVDREFPPEALQHFVDHGVARPHTLDPNASGVTERVRLSNLQREIGLGYNDGRPAPPGVRPSFNGPAHELPPGVARPDKHGFTYKEAPCLCTLLAPEPARLPRP